MTGTQAGGVALSVVIPTYDRVQFVSVLIERLIQEITECRRTDIRIVVSDNHSRDGTAEVVGDYARRYSFITCVVPPVHLSTAEENLAFLLSQSTGRHIWTFGDDDRLENGALQRVLDLIERYDPDLMILNPRILDTAGGVLKDRLLTMRESVQQMEVAALFASIGFIGLGACFSTCILRAERLERIDWESLFAVSPIYAHVAAWVRAYSGGRSVLVDEQIVSVRLGGTGHAEFRSLAQASRRPFLFPLAVGLPRLIQTLVDAALVPPDYLCQIVETEVNGRFPLLGFVVDNVCQLLVAELEEESSDAVPLNPAEIEALFSPMAAGPAVDAERYRLLHGVATIAQSLLTTSPAGLGAGTLSLDRVMALFTQAERQAIREIVHSWARPQLTGLIEQMSPREAQVPWRSSAFLLVTDIVDMVGSDVRNGISAGHERFATLGEMIEHFPEAVRETLRDTIRELLLARLKNLLAGSLTNLYRQRGFLPVQEYRGYSLIRLGRSVAALRANLHPSPGQLLNLQSVDPADDPPDIMIAGTWTELRRRVDLLPRPAWQEVVYAKFLGYELGCLNGLHLAVAVGATPEAQPASNQLRATSKVELLRLIIESVLAREPARSDYAAARAGYRRISDPGRFAGLFDAQWYQEEYPSVAERMQLLACGSAFEHFIREGSGAGFSPSVWFDEPWYRTFYPIVEAGLRDGVWFSGYEHWICQGARLGFNPAPWFDEVWYRTTYPEVAEAIFQGAYGCGFEHYLMAGSRAGLQPCDVFDPSWYLSRYTQAAAAAASGVPPFEYFLKTGLKLGDDPGPRFSAAYYLAAYPDIADALAAGHISSAFYHWMRNGRAEGRRQIAPMMIVPPSVALAAAP